MCRRCEKGNIASSRLASNPSYEERRLEEERSDVALRQEQKVDCKNAGREVVPVVEKKSHLCACVKSFGNIYLYGSSHMRYKFDYLVDKCYERPADLVKKHHNASVVNLHYTWNAFSAEFCPTGIAL